MVEYMNELINCVVCKKDTPRKNLYWDTIGSYTETCEDCHNKKAIVEQIDRNIEKCFRPEFSTKKIKK